MSTDNPLSLVKDIVGVIKLGSGILGKSAMVLGMLELAVCGAVFRVHSDTAIIVVLLLGAAFFFSWFIPIIRFAHKHPAEALLEGSQWAEHQRFQLAAKGHNPSSTDNEMRAAPRMESPSTPIKRIDEGL